MLEGGGQKGEFELGGERRKFSFFNKSSKALFIRYILSLN